jgi:hypothetical protein
VLFVATASSGPPLLGSVAFIKKPWWEDNELEKSTQNHKNFHYF